MKRSEFLKRLSLGIGAAVAAPALLKGEDVRELPSNKPEFRPGDETASGTPIRGTISSAPTWALYNKQKGYVEFFNHVT